jgi:phospholipid/cholesterol/gamma-HCH transport system substrate-binding protein
MEKKALSWTELRVGLVVIASLVILTFTILYIGSSGGSPWAATYHVKALMSDVNGLKPGAPVRLGGVEIGTVEDVDFAPAGSGMIEVAMRLDRRVKSRITTQSTVTLGAVGLLGEKAVDIAPSSKGVPIEDGGLLAGVAEDPFKGLLSDASDSTTHLKKILSRMDAGEGTIGKALRDEELYSRMVDVSVRLQQVMNKLESPSGPLGRLVNDNEMSRQLASSVRGIDTIVTRIEQGKGNLGILSKDEELVTSLKTLTRSINDITGALHRGEGSAGRLLKDDTLYKRMDSVSTRLDALVTKVEKGDGTAGRMVQDPALYENLNLAAKDLRGLIGDVRRDPRKYLRVKLSVF